MNKMIEQAAQKELEDTLEVTMSCQCANIAYEEFLQGAKYALTHQWISVDEELPPHKPIGENQRFSKTVFLMQANGDVIIDSFDFEMPSNFITHWMEIPKKGGEE